MAQLQYKTRGQMNPQGKPKVYFCCHPKDFNAYFRSISDDILKISNCSIWYDEKPLEPYDEEMFFSDLSQMQLFVMPVTSNLLGTENRALDEEFRFAIEKHIPVLPLMQEPDLDVLFNEKCGDLQYLDKNAKDKTAISYEEKLRKFLESVLIGDELAQKIRDSFDAYVFLSYRKKDRKYAQELMRLIHKNSFCRDIAIWYDEFLTPGENFNEAIRLALETSKLFAMVVTPNLVNEENYVTSVEYPMAKEAHKPIIAAEMEETDRGALGEKLDSTHKITDAYDPGALSEALLETFKEIAIRGNDDSPQHNFFIGLAYLGGVDVEVDTEKAVGMITYAAEHGVPQAIEKLAAMYANGEGVARDSEQVIRWKRKLVEVYDEIHKETKTAMDLDKWLTAWFDLATALNLVNKTQEALAEYEKLEKECIMSSLIRDMVQADSETKSQVVEDAFEYIYKRMRALSFGCMGEIYRKIGDIEKAKEYVLKGVIISEEMCDKWEQNWLWRDVSTGYYTLGELDFLKKNLEDAQKHFLASLRIKEKLAQDYDEVQFQLDLLCLYEDIAGVFKMRGDMVEALKYQQKSVDIAKVLMEDFDEGAYTYFYGKGLILLSDIYKMKGDIEEGFKSLKDALTIIEDYEIKYDTEMDYLKGFCLLKIGQMHLFIGEQDKGSPYVSRAVDALESGVEKSGSVPMKDMILGAYTIYSQMLINEGKSEEALIYCKKAMDIVKEFLTIGINIHMNDYLFVYTITASIYCEWNRLDKAKAYLAEAESLINKYSIKPDNPLSVAPFLIFYANFGDLYVAENNKAKAEEYYLKSIDVFNIYQKQFPASAMGMQIYIAYYNVAVLNEDRNNAKAMEYYKLTAENIESLSEAEKTLEAYDYLCSSYYALYRLSGFLKRKQWKLKCEQVWGIMCDTFGDACYSTDSANIFTD